MNRAALLIFGFFVLGSPAAWGGQVNPIEPGHLPSLIASLRMPESLDFCGEAVPLSNPDVRERLEKELMLAIWNRPQVILWLKRAGRYFPHVEKSLKSGGIPDDFKYLAVVESALLPHIGSARGAVGFWQFLKPTGLRYGLRIDRHIDQRRNILYATRAAAAYLQALHTKFGSWTMAAAAYNMGHKRLQSEIDLQKTDNYYRLYLPLETQRYLLKIIAVKLVFTNPQKYGFNLSAEDVYPPLAFDKVKLNCLRDTPIERVARAANTYFKVIKDLNPELRGHFLVKGRHVLLLPEGSKAGFDDRFRKLTRIAARDEQVYVVREGDNLSVIAQRFDVPLSALLLWNGLSVNKPIHPGDRLVIHPE